MIRSIYFLLFFTLFSHCLLAQVKNASEVDKPKIVFTEKAYDFGSLAEGDEAVCEFKFFNKGNTPLIIKDVSRSCSCIVTNSSAETIPPGGEGVITVEYKTTGRPGTFEKSITVVTNGEPRIVTLLVRGTVF